MLLILIVGVLAAWCAAAVVVALLLGRTIRTADERADTEGIGALVPDLVPAHSTTAA